MVRVLFNNISVLYTYNILLPKALSKLGVDVKVDIESVELLALYLYERLASNVKLNVIPFLSKSRMLLKRYAKDSDVVHLNAWNQVMADVAKQHGKPVLFVLHTAPFSKEFYEQISSFVDIIVAPSQFTLETERPKLSGMRTIVIHHGVDTELFNTSIPRPVAKRKLGLPENARVILWNDRISPEKDLKTMLEASRILLRERRDVIVYIKGRAVNKEYYGKLRELIKELESTGRVYMKIGWITHSKLPILYRAANVFVRTSLYENFGLGVIESMACGTPVIAPNAATFPEIIPYKDLLFKPGDPEELANNISRLLDDRALYKEAEELSLREIRERFDIQIVAKKYYEVYKELVE